MAPPVAPTGGNFFTRKFGPFPVWGWVAGGTGGLLALSVWRNNKQSNADAAAAAQTDNSTVPADQVPDYIFQNYSTTNVTTGAEEPGTPTTPHPPVQPPPSRGGKPPTAGPGIPRPPSKPVKAPRTYVVKHGDTLSSIAKRYGTTWQSLWTYNTTSGNRPAATIAQLKKRGPNLLYAGETIYIPAAG